MAIILLKICIKIFQQNPAGRNKQENHSSFLFKYKFIIFFLMLSVSTILLSDVLILLINRNYKINT